MAKDRISREELADKLVNLAGSAEDPIRAMAEMITDFVMEAEVSAEIGAEPYERAAECTTQRNGYRERYAAWHAELAGAESAGGRLHPQLYRASATQ